MEITMKKSKKHPCISKQKGVCGGGSVIKGDVN